VVYLIRRWLDLGYNGCNEREASDMRDQFNGGYPLVYRKKEKSVGGVKGRD